MLVPILINSLHLCSGYNPGTNKPLPVILSLPGDPGESSRNMEYKKMSKEHIYYVYILANKRNGTIY